MTGITARYTAMHSLGLNIGLISRILIHFQARSDMIRTAHIKAPRDMLALSTSFKLMLRTGCLVLTGLLKSQQVRLPTDNLILHIRQWYRVPNDPPGLIYCCSQKSASEYSSFTVSRHPRSISMLLVLGNQRIGFPSYLE